MRQNVGSSLSENTQLQVDWGYSEGVASLYTAAQGIDIRDANGKLVFLSIQAVGYRPSSLIELAAGDYQFGIGTYNGVTRYFTGETKLDWSATASIRAVPETSSWAMMGLGLAGVAMVARRRSAAAQA